MNSTFASSNTCGACEVSSQEPGIPVFAQLFRSALQNDIAFVFEDFRKSGNIIPDLDAAEAAAAAELLKYPS